MDDVGGSERDEHPLSDEPTAVSARLEVGTRKKDDERKYGAESKNTNLERDGRRPEWAGVEGLESLEVGARKSFGPVNHETLTRERENANPSGKMG